MPRIIIDEARCKGCALCTAACPRNLLSLNETLNKAGILPARIASELEGRCISCARCAQMCPDLAITVFRPSTPEGEA